MSTVDHADIRGLVTTLLVSVGRLPRSMFEDLFQPHNVVEGCAKPGLRLFPWSWPWWEWVNKVTLVRCCHEPVFIVYGRTGWTSRAMAHMKAAISRAMAAVTATVNCTPRLWEQSAEPPI